MWNINHKFKQMEDMDKQILEPIWSKIINRMADHSDKMTVSAESLFRIVTDMKAEAVRLNNKKLLRDLEYFNVTFKDLLQGHSDMLKNMEELIITLEKNYGIKINNN